MAVLSLAVLMECTHQWVHHRHRQWTTDKKHRRLQLPLGQTASFAAAAFDVVVEAADAPSSAASSVAAPRDCISGAGCLPHTLSIYLWWLRMLDALSVCLSVCFPAPFPLPCIPLTSLPVSLASTSAVLVFAWTLSAQPEFSPLPAGSYCSPLWDTIQPNSDCWLLLRLVCSSSFSSSFSACQLGTALFLLIGGGRWRHCRLWC